jgi:hypothetical protein
MNFCHIMIVLFRYITTHEYHLSGTPLGAVLYVRGNRTGPSMTALLVIFQSDKADQRPLVPSRQDSLNATTGRFSRQQIDFATATPDVLIHPRCDLSHSHSSPPLELQSVILPPPGYLISILEPGSRISRRIATGVAACCEQFPLGGTVMI